MLENLEPKKVFEFFEELTKIPRPSYKEKKVSDFLVKFAEDRGLEHYQDELGNVIIIKEAAKGYENEIPVILHGHMDMVCEKEPGLDKNMDEEGVDVTYDDKFVFAKGTSLGGDDGAGGAAYAARGAERADAGARHARAGDGRAGGGDRDRADQHRTAPV